MLFNSIAFVIFLPIVFLLYWLINNRSIKFQNIILLVASYYFYACWDWRFLFLLIFSTLLDYYTGLKIAAAEHPAKRKQWLLISLIVNLGFLGIFKYFNFFVGSFVDALQLFGIKINPLTLQVILPVGISFYTFHGISYVVDIYRRKIDAEKNFIEYAVFVCFFPLLVAGPIERATHLLPQVKTKRTFDKILFNEGLVQIAVGFFRKIVVADTLAKYVDTIYGNPSIYNSSTLVIATIFYAFQIYFDFAGYSDIAIGTAKLFGFRLLQNFRLPYFSKTITEFWRKWHISLSFWLRDYLYIELGGNRKGIVKTYRNLMLTMLLGGLWHGANWTFIVWGGIHGSILCVEKFIMPTKLGAMISRISWLGFLYTFSVVSFAWIFFRAQSLHEAWVVVKGIGKLNFGLPFIGDMVVLINSVFVLSIAFLFDLYLRIRNTDLEFLGTKMTFSKIVIFVSVVFIIILMFFSTSNNFIYFQF